MLFTIISFKKEIKFRHYDLQAYMYCFVRGYDPQNFRFIAVENKNPFTTEVYALSDEMIETGRQKFFQAFEKWKYYLKTGIALVYDTDDLMIRKDGSLLL